MAGTVSTDLAFFPGATTISSNRCVNVWKVTSDGKLVKVATIEQGERKQSMCDDCPSPCCQGMFRPILTSDEFVTRRFPTMFVDVPEWLREKVPRAEKLVVLAFTNGTSCNYFDSITCRCTIWPNCPKGCLAYDCREDIRPEIKEFVQKASDDR